MKNVKTLFAVLAVACIANLAHAQPAASDPGGNSFTGMVTKIDAPHYSFELTYTATDKDGKLKTQKVTLMWDAKTQVMLTTWDGKQEPMPQQQLTKTDIPTLLANTQKSGGQVQASAMMTANKYVTMVLLFPAQK